MWPEHSPSLRLCNNSDANMMNTFGTFLLAHTGKYTLKPQPTLLTNDWQHLLQHMLRLD